MIVLFFGYFQTIYAAFINFLSPFFFQYPQPFPWHLLHFWDELENWSLERVLSGEGQEVYGETFRNLSGEHIDWAQRCQAAGN